MVYSMFTTPSMRSTDLVSERLCENPKQHYRLVIPVGLKQSTSIATRKPLKHGVKISCTIYRRLEQLECSLGSYPGGHWFKSNICNQINSYNQLGSWLAKIKLNKSPPPPSPKVTKEETSWCWGEHSNQGVRSISLGKCIWTYCCILNLISSRVSL